MDIYYYVLQTLCDKIVCNNNMRIWGKKSDLIQKGHVNLIVHITCELDFVAWQWAMGLTILQRGVMHIFLLTSFPIFLI